MWADWALPEEFQGVFTPALLELSRCSQVVIAGGAVMAAGRFAASRDPALLTQVADIDIFITGSQGIAAVESAVFADADTQAIMNAPWGTFMVNNPRYSTAPLQFVFSSLGATAAEVLGTFDMDCVAACLRLGTKTTDSGAMVPTLQLGTLTGTREAWAHNVATVVNALTLSERRILGTREKGFTVAFASPEVRTQVQASLEKALPRDQYFPKHGVDVTRSVFDTLTAAVAAAAGSEPGALAGALARAVEEVLAKVGPEEDRCRAKRAEYFDTLMTGPVQEARRSVAAAVGAKTPAKKFVTALLNDQAREMWNSVACRGVLAAVNRCVAPGATFYDSMVLPRTAQAFQAAEEGLDAAAREGFLKSEPGLAERTKSYLAALRRRMDASPTPARKRGGAIESSPRSPVSIGSQAVEAL